MRSAIHGETGGIIGTLVSFVAFVAVVIVFPQYTLGLLSAALIVDETPRQSDAIVILLSQNSPERTIKAADLFEEGFAPRIVMASGEDLSKQLEEVPPGFSWQRSSETNRTGLRSLGIQDSDIVIVDAPAAYDTNHELQAVAEYARRSSWNSVILVTSMSHTRRVDMIWGRVAPRIERRVIGAGQQGFRTWWNNARGRKILAYEYGAMMKELGTQLAHFLGGVISTARERGAPPVE